MSGKVGDRGSSASGAMGRDLIPTKGGVLSERQLRLLHQHRRRTVDPEQHLNARPSGLPALSGHLLRRHH
jgi:hypothetical protein